MDILLDSETHDIVFVNGQAPITDEMRLTVAQRLKVRLQTFLGEYFMNVDAGIPYYQRIFGKIKNKSTVDAIFQRQILDDPDVIEIVSYDSDLDAASRFLSVTFKVRTSEGSITSPITINVGA